MTGSPSLPAAFVVAVSILLTTGAGPSPHDERGPFVADALADGIYVLHPREPSPERTNSLVVVRSDGLLVVNAQPSAASARELLAEIGRLSAAPVRYLVLPHPHADAAAGATAFPEGTLRIAAKGYAQAIQDPDYDWAAEWRREEAGGEPPARVLPSLVLTCSTTLADSERAVVIEPIPRAHSSGDLVVWVPAASVVAVGSLVFGRGAPCGADASPTGWIRALNQIATHSPRYVVPLRGPVTDDRGVRIQRDTLLWIRGQIAQAFVDGVPSNRIADRVLQNTALREYFEASTSRSAVRGLVEAAVEEAREERRQRGLPD